MSFQMSWSNILQWVHPISNDIDLNNVIMICSTFGVVGSQTHRKNRIWRLPKVPLICWSIENPSHIPSCCDSIALCRISEKFDSINSNQEQLQRAKSPSLISVTSLCWMSFIEKSRIRRSAFEFAFIELYYFWLFFFSPSSHAHSMRYIFRSSLTTLLD